MSSRASCPRRWPPGSFGPSARGEPQGRLPRWRRSRCRRPGAFEVIVRGDGGRGQFQQTSGPPSASPSPCSATGDHEEYGHHIGGSDALRDRLEGRRGRHQVEARRRGRDPLQTRPRTRTSRCTVSIRSPPPSQKIWGYETTWGSFAQFTKVQAQQLLAKPRNLSWAESSAYGLTYFTAYRMLIDQCKLQAGHKRSDLGRGPAASASSPRSCARRRGANAVGVVSLRRQGRVGQAPRRSRLHQPQTSSRG